MVARNERCHRSSIDFELPSSFFTTPDFFSQSFPASASFSLKLLHKKMWCDCTCSLVSTKHVCFTDRIILCETQLWKKTFLIDGGTGAVASCYSGRISIALEMAEGRSGPVCMWAADSQMGSAVCILLFWFNMLPFFVVKFRFYFLQFRRGSYRVRHIYGTWCAGRSRCGVSDENVCVNVHLWC